MYEVNLDKTLDAEGLTSAILGEESNGYVFQRNEIRDEAGEKINAATFEVDPDGKYPKDCVLLVRGEKAPENHAKQWEGKMLVAKVECDVELHRAN
jgi:hypothetical protein